jgi:hypothetical protein
VVEGGVKKRCSLTYIINIIKSHSKQRRLSHVKNKIKIILHDSTFTCKKHLRAYHRRRTLLRLPCDPGQKRGK